MQLLDESSKSRKIELTFIKLALIFGILFVFLTPPMQSPDEDSHYRKSVSIAFGYLLPQGTTGSATMKIPKAALDFASAYNGLIGNMDQKYTFSQMVFSNWLPADWSQVVDVPYSTAESCFILHLPQAAGMVIGRLLSFVLGKNSFTPITAMYMGRLGNLLFYIFLITLAIKLSPVYKRLIFAAGLLPTMLFLASTESYDVFAYGGVTLLIAYILNLWHNKKIANISYKEHLILAFIALLIVLGKFVYIPAILLALFIPSSKYRSLKNKILCNVLTGGVILALYLLFKTVNGIYLNAAAGGASQSSQQVAFILANPFQFIWIVLRTIKNMAFLYLKNGLATLGAIDTNFPSIIVIFVIFYLLFMILADGLHSVNNGIGYRLAILAMTLGIVGLIEAALYVSWTSLPQYGGVGAPIVDGVQGRYFLPLIPIFAQLFSFKPSGNKIREKLDNMAETIYVPCSKFFLAASGFILLLRYWVG
ncbi:MAG: DUF2142 domain-containing protein [Clostridiaceae bacterium]|nr:DUF2142 domain-containing protein [Clostridiaceae bacterium]